MAYKIQYIADSLPKKDSYYPSRSASDITDLVIHHSAADARFGPHDFAQWHLAKGWAGIGYHYVVMADGKIYQTNEHTTASWHTGGNNSYTLGVLLSGNFVDAKVPKKQLDAAVWLLKRLKRQLPNVQKIGAHREYSNTLCPGKHMPMGEIQRRVQGSPFARDAVLALALALLAIALMVYAIQ